MASEKDVKRQSLASVDSGIASVVFVDVEPQNSLAVPDDASSLTSPSNTSLLSLPVSHCSIHSSWLGGTFFIPLFMCVLIHPFVILSMPTLITEGGHSVVCPRRMGNLKVSVE